MSDPRYPIGKFERPASLTAPDRRALIDEIAAAPAILRDAVRGLDSRQLDTPYREGGWTVRQVVHHLPDSHMNGYTRFKLALTEEQPTIKPYDEAAWAKLDDIRSTPIETSLNLLEALHDRWVRLLRSLPENVYGRRFQHPETGEGTIDSLLAMYAWHGRHHTAQITTLRSSLDWR